MNPKRILQLTALGVLPSMVMTPKTYATEVHKDHSFVPTRDEAFNYDFHTGNLNKVQGMIHIMFQTGLFATLARRYFLDQQELEEMEQCMERYYNVHYNDSTGYPCDKEAKQIFKDQLQHLRENKRNVHKIMKMVRTGMSPQEARLKIDERSKKS
jgi:hypothetical protein